MYSDYEDTVKHTTGMYPVILFNFIRENSDEFRHLTVDDLVDHLQGFTKDGVKIASVRKNVERNLQALADSDKRIRVVYENGDEYCTKTMSFSFSDVVGIYFDQPFSAGDIRILSDAVIYSSHLKRSEREELLKKVAALRPSHSNQWYKNAVQDSTQLSRSETDLFKNLEFIDHAIAEKKCIKFHLASYNNNKRLQISKTQHVGFAPLKIFIQGGMYYVVGITDRNKQRHDEAADAEDPDYFLTPIPIHIMRKICFDDLHEYTEIKNTKLSKYSLKDLNEGLWGSINILGKQSLMVTSDVEFITTLEGLNVLIEVFGTGLRVNRINREKLPNSLLCQLPKDESATEERYSVILQKPGIHEWYKLLPILFESSVEDIYLNSHHSTLRRMITRISSCLNAENAKQA